MFRRLAFIAVLLISQEARVSVVPDYVDMKTVIAKSTSVVVAKVESKSPKGTSGEAISFRVLEVLSGDAASMKLNSVIDVFGANADLFAEIAAAGRRGEATPMPILAVYKSSLEGQDLSKLPEVILFLAKDGKGRPRFAAENSYEAVSLKEKVLALLPLKIDTKSKSALDKFDSLPKVMSGAPGSEEASEKYRQEKRPFVVAVAFRNLNTCKSGAHEFINVVYHVYRPKLSLLGRSTSIEMRELEVHETRTHGAPLRSDLVAFLEAL
ncbi:hypothetical protein BH10BDE1_BH10BDE1_31080 [soil metagenome]